MPSQQVEIAEAIAGVKRALKRERGAPSDQPIVAASNRGNKLKLGAKYVHEGSLAYVSGPEAYKEKVDHAGYTRYVLDRNPRRYNEYGEELEDSETDQEADADAADQNAYSGIRLEELLCPLKHPSELPIHPTMSHAYLSSTLPDMVQSTHEQLRQERANLWRAKHLNRQLMGDACWIPAGAVESPEDWHLFEPRVRGTQRRPDRKRKREEVERGDQKSKNDATSDIPPQRNGYDKSEVEGGNDSSAVQTNGTATVEDSATGHQVKATLSETSSDQQQPHSDVPIKTISLEPVVNETSEKNGGSGGQVGVDENVENRASQLKKDDADTRSEARLEKAGRIASKDDTPPSPPRPITRALTATNNSNAPTPPLSGPSSITSSTSSSQVKIDPLYLVPGHANPSKSAANLRGLPPDEALETRRLLTLYIQKQDESVRGYEAILSKLLTAQRLRTEVLEMCKAEEHVGELSDGEDWIDAERWGLQPGELRKGRDEDDDVMEENTIGGRKGKRRGRN